MYSNELDLITYLKVTHGEWVKLQILVCPSIDKKSGWGNLTPAASLVARPLQFTPVSFFLLFRNINTAAFKSNAYQLSNDGAVRSIVNCIYS